MPKTLDSLPSAVTSGVELNSYFILAHTVENKDGNAKHVAQPKKLEGCCVHTTKITVEWVTLQFSLSRWQLF